MRCKNEAHILERWLERTSEVADAIVALDDASQDDSYKILKSHPKVITCLQNPDRGGRWYQVRDLNQLLTEVKRHNPEWIYFSDADELADGRLPNMLDDLLARKEVGQYLFREITLWRSITHYRVDRPNEFMRIHPENISLIRNVPTIQWKCVRPYHVQAYRALKQWARGQSYNFLRHPGTHDRAFVGVQGEVVHLGDTYKLHYHFVDWDKAWVKQMRFVLNQVLAHTGYRMSDIDKLIDWGKNRMDETGLQLEPVQPEWRAL